jgi:hypothetical protein
MSKRDAGCLPPNRSQSCISPNELSIRMSHCLIRYCSDHAPREAEALTGFQATLAPYLTVELRPGPGASWSVHWLSELMNYRVLRL